MSCPTNKIRRVASYVKGYTKEDGTKVSGYYRKSTCVPDKGAPGKTPKSKQVLPTPKKGLLAQYGYEDVVHTKASSRHRSLKKAVGQESYATVVRQLNVVANYTKVSNPSFHALVKRDMRWLKKEYRSE